MRTLAAIPLALASVALVVILAACRTAVAVDVQGR